MIGSTHPLLAPQPDNVERVVSVLPDIAASQYVEDWPEDERAYHRGGDWHSFTDRAEKLQRVRKVKTAYAVLGVLGVAQGGDGVKALGAPGEWTDERRELLELLLAHGPVTLEDVRAILGEPDPGITAPPPR